MADETHEPQQGESAEQPNKPQIIDESAADKVVSELDEKISQLEKDFKI